MESKFDAQTEAACEVWWNSFQSGPVRTRWTESPLQVGDAAPGFELPDASGELVSLDSFWQEKPALILFWRHYGCGCGLDRSARLNDEMADYEKAGREVVMQYKRLNPWNVVPKGPRFSSKSSEQLMSSTT